MKERVNNLLAKSYSFFYFFIFWGFYFSAGYLFCKNKYNSLLMSTGYNII